MRRSNAPSMRGKAADVTKLTGAALAERLCGGYKSPVLPTRTLKPVAIPAPPTPSELAVKPQAHKFCVLYSRISNRKHRHWEDDGALVVQGKNIRLESSSQKVLAEEPVTDDEVKLIKPGYRFNLELFDVEVLDGLPSENFSRAKNEVSKVKEEIPCSSNAVTTPSFLPSSSGVANNVLVERRFNDYQCPMLPGTSRMNVPMYAGDLTDIKVRRFSVLFTKVNTRKHKTYEFDGILNVEGTAFRLLDPHNSGLTVATAQKTQTDVSELCSGLRTFIGGYEMEVQEELKEVDIVDLAIFCLPSSLQITLYEKVLDTIALDNYTTFDFLCRLCAHPANLYCRLLQFRSMDPGCTPINRLIAEYPPGSEQPEAEVSDSGKLFALFKLVTTLIEAGEKCVVVASESNSLDLIEAMLEGAWLDVLRLDKGTTGVERARLIKKFNYPEVPREGPFSVFLLHSKAPTDGHDFPTANRLILYDVDNRLVDELGLEEKVWRNGLGRRCFIYRLITETTIEELIFRRKQRILREHGGRRVPQFTEISDLPEGECSALFKSALDAYDPELHQNPSKFWTEQSALIEDLKIADPALFNDAELCKFLYRVETMPRMDAALQKLNNR